MVIKARMWSRPVKDDQPKKELHYLGGKALEATGASGKWKWRWEIWRRGIKSTKTMKVEVKRKRYKPKKWGKRSKKKDHVLRLVEVSTGGKITTFKVIDRGPRYVTKDSNPRYRLMASGYHKQSRGVNTIALAEASISKYIKRQRAIKVKQPSYVLILPHEQSSRAKQKSGFNSLQAAKTSMNKQVADKRQFLKEANGIIKRMKAEMRRPSPSLRKWSSISKSFIRTKKTVLNTKALKVQVLGYTKRVDAEPRKLSELLAVRQVKWTLKTARKTRTQSASFLLTRWGYGKKLSPQWLPSYTVTDIDGVDVAFTNRQGEKGEDVIHVEQFEKVTYTARPIRLARAELERQVGKFVKSLQRGVKAEVNPEHQINRGVGTETVGNYRIKVIKYGLKRGYPSIGGAFHNGKAYNLIGGVVLEIYKKGARTPHKTKEWQIIKPKTLKARKKEGSSLLVRRGGSRIGSYRSGERARAALRKALNKVIYSLHE